MTTKSITALKLQQKLDLTSCLRHAHGWSPACLPAFTTVPSVRGNLHRHLLWSVAVFPLSLLGMLTGELSVHGGVGKWSWSVWACRIHPIGPRACCKHLWVAWLWNSHGSWSPSHVELGGAADGAVLMCFLKSIAISSGFTRCPKLIFATRKCQGSCQALSTDPARQLDALVELQAWWHTS